MKRQKMKNLSFKLLALSIGLAAIVSCIAIGVAVTPDVTDHIVIQAIEQNPPGDSNRYEWVMLYNPTDNSVNISNWTLVSHFWRGTNTTIVANTTLHPKKYLTVIPDRRWLHDEDAPIMLIDAEGNVIDKTPVLSDRHDDERIWQRYPVGRDTDTDTDWMFGLLMQIEEAADVTAKYVYDGEIEIAPASSKTEILSYENGTRVNLEILRSEFGKLGIVIPSEFVPYANFSYAPLNPVANQSMTFDAAASWTFDPNAAIITYVWDFGDGTNGTGMIANHTYALPGEYMVCLEVTDEEQRCNTRYMPITIQ